MKIKSIYIASLQENAGSLVISMGLMELLKKRFGKVAFFRPVILNSEYKDQDIEFMLEYFALKQEYSSSYGFTLKDADSLLAQNKLHDLIEELIAKFKKLQEEYDFILVEGLCRNCFSAAIDFDLNLEIAKNIGSPIASVINGKNKSEEVITEEIKIENDSIKSNGIIHFASFINRLSADVQKNLQNNFSDTPTYFLPEINELDKPTVSEVMEQLGCELLFGEEKDMKKVVYGSKIAAMNVEHFLSHISNGDMIIVPGDRADIIIASYASLYSREYPNISCILLTGNLTPVDSVTKLLKGFGQFPLPVLKIKTDTWKTALNVEHIRAQINSKSERKIALAMGLFNDNVDITKIDGALKTESTSITTPISFEFGLFEKAKSKRKKIVLPESSDERILRATEILIRRNVVDIVLLGNKDEINYQASQLGLHLDNVEIIDPNNSEYFDDFVDTFYELRREKGLTRDAARDAMVHLSYFGTMMIHKGLADGMVSGAIHTTADTIRPGLQIIKTLPGISIVSSVFFMCLDTRVLVYGDCAVNQNPTAEQLAEIAISSADTAMKFGIEPRIAMLSYSTGTSGAGEDVEKVKIATEIVKTKRPDLPIEGPIQYDAAIDPDVARTKLPNSTVAGKATIFIFPDLNTGNNTYKAVQRSANAVAIGPILQGLRKPINDLSRGCLVADIVNTVAITAIQAQS